MSLAAHITFYNSGDKPASYSRLQATVASLQSIGADVFVHTNRESDFSWLSGTARVVVHDIKTLHPFYMSVMSRDTIYDTYNNYDYTMYIEDDIIFTQLNWDYYLKYHNLAKSNGGYLSFLRYERNMNDGELYFTDVLPVHKVSPSFVSAEGVEFIYNVPEYCAMWLLDRDEVATYATRHGNQFWLRDGLPYGSWYLIRENAALGPVGNMFSRDKVYRVDAPGVLIEHNSCRVLPIQDNRDGTCTIRASTLLKNGITGVDFSSTEVSDEN